MKVSRSQGPFEQYVYLEEQFKIRSVERIAREKHTYEFIDLYEMETGRGKKIRAKAGFGGPDFDEKKGRRVGEKLKTLLEKLEDKEVKITGLSDYTKEEIYPAEIRINEDSKLAFENSLEIPDRYFMVNDLLENLKSQSITLPPKKK